MAPLTKLLIEAFSDIGCSKSSKVDEFEVMFNPTSYSQKYDVEYEESQGQGTTGSTQKFGTVKPQEYNVEVLFDGTGASGIVRNVADDIEQLLVLAGKMDGDTHRPLFLKISWGRLVTNCVLKSANITYTLFKPDGEPLRAKMSAVFSEAIEEVLRVAEEGKNSPDLTHVRVMGDADTLPLMAHRIYGSPEYYQRVARFNGLSTVRRVPPGTTVSFPPLVTLLAQEAEQ